MFMLARLAQNIDALQYFFWSKFISPLKLWARLTMLDWNRPRF